MNIVIDPLFDEDGEEIGLIYIAEVNGPEKPGDRDAALALLREWLIDRGIDPDAKDVEITAHFDLRTV